MTENKSLGFLADAITDLSTRVEKLTTDFDDLTEGGGGAGNAMAEQVRALEAAVVELRKAAGAGGRRARQKHDMQIPWHRLTMEQAEKRWLELQAWVNWLVARNDIGPKEIPKCWYLHGGYVDELEALRWAWVDSYGPDAKGTDPVWWREALSRARMRLPAFNVNGCNINHAVGSRQSMDDDRHWRDFLAEDLAARLPTSQEQVAS